MNNIIKGAFIFIAGAAVGAFATKKYFETKYSQIAQEAIDSVKEVYTYKKPVADDDEEVEDEPDPSTVKEMATKAKDKPNILEYANILKREGYIPNETENDDEEDDWEEITHPYVIDPDDFGQEYTTFSMTYYAGDGVLSDDETDTIVKNPKELVGTDFMNHFGEYEDGVVFVRNDEKQIDYDIYLDKRKSTEVTDAESWARGY